MDDNDAKMAATKAAREARDKKLFDEVLKLRAEAEARVHAGVAQRREREARLRADAMALVNERNKLEPLPRKTRTLGGAIMQAIEKLWGGAGGIPEAADGRDDAISKVIACASWPIPRDLGPLDARRKAIRRAIKQLKARGAK